MPELPETTIHPLTDIHPEASIGQGVRIGAFCKIGPDVTLGDGCVLDSHVTIIGRTSIGCSNRFWPGVVIGGEPQDISFKEDADVGVEIGENNIFREGVTVHRGAEKEDGMTRIGNGNMLMANSHVAHNCNIGNNTYLVNGVLLGGHVHMQDGAIISGNSVVHHFSTLGTLSFVSGGCRVPHDVPPYMLSAGSDNPQIRNINIVGMKRAGISNNSIRAVKKAFKLLFREHKKVEVTREMMLEDLGGIFPLELSNLFNFIEQSRDGRMGRGRETNSVNTTKNATQKKDAA